MIILYRRYTQEETGLFLFPPPTGSGKTYHAVRFMYENLLNDSSGRQFIFCSNRIATSITDPYRDLVKLIEQNHDAEESEQLKSRILPLYSESEQFRRFFKSDWKNILPGELLKSRKVRENLENLENILLEHRNGKFKLNEEYVSQQVRECKKEIAKYLNAKIDFLKNECGCKYKEASDEIFRNERPWLVKVLPSYYFDEFDIVLTTFQKLMSGFVSQNGFKNLIFSQEDDNRKRIFLIDEFDTTKRLLLDHLFKGEMIGDLVGDFLRLASARPFSKEHKEIAEGLSGTLKKMNTLAEELKLYDPIKSEISGFATSYIFRDDSPIYSQEMGGGTSLLYDEKSGRNRIVNGKSDDQGHSLMGVVNRLAFFVNVKIPKTIGHAAYSYQKIQNMRGEDIELADAMRTVMSRLNYKEEQNEIMRRFSILRGARNSWKINRGSLRNFYERGFYWFSLRDGESHQEDTHIHYESMRLTPEQAMLSLAQRHRVVGISATSEMKGLVYNYDIEFFKDRLGEQFDILTDEEIKTLRKEVADTRDYTDISIEAKFIDASNIDTAIYSAAGKFYGDEKKMRDFLKNDFLAGLEKHEKARVLTIFYLLANFIENSIQSFIYYGNRKKMVEEHLDSLRKLLRLWLRNMQKNFHLVMISEDRYGFWRGIGNEEWVDDRLGGIMGFVETVDAERYRSEYSEICRKERFFIYTTYGSLKEGVNLHYPFDPSLKDELACVFTKRSDVYERDIEAIFLEKPTYLFDQGVGDDYVLRKDLYSLLTMHQTADKLGRFETKESETPYMASLRVKTQYVRRLFEKSTIPEGGRGMNILFEFYERYLPEHFAFDVVASAMQTIGRICRACYKSRRPRIYLDSFYKKPIEIYAGSEMSERILHLEEFDAVIGKARENGHETVVESVDRFSAHTLFANEKGRVEIERLLGAIEIGREKAALMETAKKDWEGLRDLLLRHPTLSDLRDVALSDEDTEGGRSMAVSPPQNIYTKTDQKTDRYWHKGPPDNIAHASEAEMKEWTEVSDRLLKLCCKVGGVEEHLKSKGYATRWKPGHFILTPIMFNNIYKGALGEVVGSFLMEKWLRVGLLPLNDNEYELFDAKTESGVYLDFKAFSSETTARYDVSENLKKKILKKIGENPQVKRVAIVGLSGDKAHHIRYYTADFTYCRNPKEAVITVIPNLIDESGETINKYLSQKAKELKRWMEK